MIGSGLWSIGGDLTAPGNLTQSAGGTVRGNLFLGGTLSASAALTVDGNADVVKLPLPSKVTVLGTTTGGVRQSVFLDLLG